MTMNIKQKVELGFAVLAVFVFSLFMINNPSIAGFVTAETFTQKVDITLEESARIAVESISKKPIQLNSLMVSGNIEGNGLVEIYLVSGADKWLVYSNLKKKATGLTKLTGIATGAMRIYEEGKLDGEIIRPENYQTITGPFKHACADTCFVTGLPRTYYFLEIWLQQGTKLQLDEIKYGIRE